MTATVHPMEQANRLAKARKIADCPVLTLEAVHYRTVADGIDADTVDGLYAQRTIAELAGVSMPSAATLRLVAYTLDERARQADLGFEGLPR